MDLKNQMVFLIFVAIFVVVGVELAAGPQDRFALHFLNGSHWPKRNREHVAPSTILCTRRRRRYRQFGSRLPRLKHFGALNKPGGDNERRYRFMRR